MAKVYRAWDTMLEMDRAIKVLNPNLVRSRTLRERFLQEARTMARLRHPNIVQWLDVATAPHGYDEARDPTARLRPALRREGTYSGEHICHE